MTYYEANQLAIDLMKHFGVWELGWRFKWGHGKRSLGSASWSRNKRTGEIEPNKLTMSKYLVQLNGADESYVPFAEQEPGHVPGHIEDVIRHEIAHMIAGHEAHHGPRWKAAAIRCGARPNRLADRSVKVVKARYDVVCLGCGKVVGKRHKRVRLENRFHPSCGYPKGVLALRHAA